VAGRGPIHWERWFRRWAVTILILAAFNVFFRLDREIVTDWDESLYAISAAETAKRDHWLATTFGGRLDYYNTKPPLNVWLIALSYRAFGINLFSLRLASALAAWTTVLVLVVWGRRAFGAPTALFAGLVLSCAHGFLYVHSGRSANTDAIFTLMVLLTVVILWVGRDRPWFLAWLGAVFAAVFLLRGMGVLMPLTLAVAAFALSHTGVRERGRPLAAALALFLAPVAAWAVARWRFDQWEFLGRLFFYDFFARTVRPLESHTGSLLYYPNNLQKDHYEWLLAAVAVLWLLPMTRQRLRCLVDDIRGDRDRRAILMAWLGATVAIPTLMQTKLAWYLNPFYPLFALVIGRIFAQGFC
jgi:4-amino-4-deoxy-L-arabinose transferase